MNPPTNAANFVVLGASGGIGSAVSTRLRQAGHRVMLASRGSDHLSHLAAELDSPAKEIDATNFAQIDACLDHATELFGHVDGVVNCVGSVLLKPAHLTTAEEWQQTLAINLTSAFATVRSVGTRLAKQGGSVVLLSSSAAQIGLSNHEAISAAKAGIIGLAKSASATYARRGIRFNVVAPGLVKTKLTQKIWENERAAETSRKMHALGRLGEPDEIASLICWLLDPANSWIAGEVISLDGGLSSIKLSQS